MASGYAPYTQDLASSLLPPWIDSTTVSLQIFGIDKLGRDILSRMALAAAYHCSSGLGVAVSMVMALFLPVAGYFRG